jgi:6-phosphofructokinase 1
MVNPRPCREAFNCGERLMNEEIYRIAINIGGRYVPGINAVITGAVLAASELGWEVVGVRDWFDGLLFRDRYPDHGLMKLTPQMVETILPVAGGILGLSPRSDPFCVRKVSSDHHIEETDRSGELLDIIRAEGIDAIISIVGRDELGIAWKINRKGLRTVCVPKSIENDVAATSLSFGFNSALAYVIDTVDRIRIAAETLRRIAVVEVLGMHAGWLALQTGIATNADAVLIPEIPYDLSKVRARIRKKLELGRHPTVVLVAEGATPIAEDTQLPSQGSRVIDRSGLVAETVALELQRLTDYETFFLVLGQLVRGGMPTAVDRQLGMGYGAGAVRALKNDQNGVMVAFQPPDLVFVPLAEAINKIRVVPANSEFVQVARALGISLGD